MSNFYWARLDYRLVHGQVCVCWIPQLEISKVIIVHDKLGKDKFMAKVHAMAVPKGVVCETWTSEKAIEEWNANQFGEGRILVLFPNAETAYKMWHAGFKFPRLQIGTMSSAEGKKLISPQIYVGQEDAKLFRELMDNGVDIFCQLVSTDPERKLADLLQKAQL